MLADTQVRTDEWYDTGLHVAAFDATFGKAKPVFLQYKLPAVALLPPIQVCAHLLDTQAACMHAPCASWL